MEDNSKFATVALNTIVVDIENSSRLKLQSDAIKRYAAVYRNCPERMPPLDVIESGDGLILFDGFHRYEALRVEGLSEAYVQIHEGIPLGRLPYQASLKNGVHGLPMTLKELRKKAFTSYIKAKRFLITKEQPKSLREIAQEFNGVVGYTTIRNWMMKDFPATYAKYYEKEEGGDEELMEVHPDIRLLVQAQTLRDQQQAIYLALQLSKSRGELLKYLEEQIDDLKGARTWHFEEDPFEVTGF